MPHALPPPMLIQDAGALARMLADIAGQHEIAVDTEADSFFNYREKVCLVQVTVEDRDYLLDPLAGFDMAPLGEILADPRKEKIFHDGEYDVLILKRDFGFCFQNLFDTRVAAAVLGEAQPGLASVLKSRFEVELDKSMQRSNWSARPLSAKQIAYARLDTRFLIPLARAQKRELEAKNRRRIVDGECRRLEQLVPSANAFDPDEYARLQGARQLDGLGQQALRELFILRDQLASESDLPPFKVLHNDTLISLAMPQARSASSVRDLPGLSPRQAQRFGARILEALERARALGPIGRPPQLRSKDGTGELDDTEYELHERLKEWRRGQAAREGFDASLVLNRHVLLRLATHKPRTPAELDRIEGLLDWQKAEMGPALVALIERSLRDFQHAPPSSRRRNPRRG